jgi:hypothetical protein
MHQRSRLPAQSPGSAHAKDTTAFRAPGKSGSAFDPSREATSQPRHEGFPALALRSPERGEKEPAGPLSCAVENAEPPVFSIFFDYSSLSDDPALSTVGDAQISVQVDVSVESRRDFRAARRTSAASSKPWPGPREDASHAPAESMR